MMWICHSYRWLKISRPVPSSNTGLQWKESMIQIQVWVHLNQSLHNQLLHLAAWGLTTLSDLWFLWHEGWFAFQDERRMLLSPCAKLAPFLRVKGEVQGWLSLGSSSAELNPWQLVNVVQIYTSVDERRIWPRTFPFSVDLWGYC